VTIFQNISKGEKNTL